MLLCTDKCNPICDFCKYHRDSIIDNICKDEGECILKNEKVKCWEMCEEFICFNVEKIK